MNIYKLSNKKLADLVKQEVILGMWDENYNDKVDFVLSFLMKLKYEKSFKKEKGYYSATLVEAVEYEGHELFEVLIDNCDRLIFRAKDGISYVFDSQFDHKSDLFEYTDEDTKETRHSFFNPSDIWPFDFGKHDDQYEYDDYKYLRATLEYDHEAWEKYYFWLEKEAN